MDIPRLDILSGSCILAFLVWSFGAAAAGSAPVQVPQDLAKIVGLRSFVKGDPWTRTASLGAAPQRQTDALPLSDQANTEGWAPYEPLSDEFNDAALDASKWWNFNPTWKGRQPGYFDPANVVVGDGRLDLWMRLGDVPEDAKEEGYGKYTCSFVKSDMPVKYGYFEIKAKPGSSSSAFWFYNAAPEEWTEIDVFEIAAVTPKMKRQYYMNGHVFYSPTVTSHLSNSTVWNAPWDLAADYHVYGLAWDADFVRYYVDGVLVRAMKNVHWHQELYLCFDCETMPEWFPIPGDETFPTVYSIEYVRAWKSAADAEAGAE